VLGQELVEAPLLQLHLGKRNKGRAKPEDGKEECNPSAATADSEGSLAQQVCMRSC